jgi:hypothetical protein
MVMIEFSRLRDSAHRRRISAIAAQLSETGEDACIPNRDFKQVGWFRISSSSRVPRMLAIEWKAIFTCLFAAALSRDLRRRRALLPSWLPWICQRYPMSEDRTPVACYECAADGSNPRHSPSPDAAVLAYIVDVSMLRA